MIEEIMAKLPEHMKVQAVKTNAAFREMVSLQSEQTDLSERVHIAEALWAREDRIWKQMIKETAKAKEQTNGKSKAQTAP